MSHRIVFIDKKEKLQGPFSERQVQEWYRTAWFDRGFRFSFLSPSEQFGDQSTTYSLGNFALSKYELYNGRGCPFSGPPTSQFGLGDDDRAARLVMLEKEIEAIRSDIDSVLALEQRVERVEQQIEEIMNPMNQALTETSPIADSATALPDRVGKECTELASLVASSTMQVLDQLQSGSDAKWDENKGRELIERVDAFLAAHSQQEDVLQLASKLVMQQLMQLLEDREFVYCSLCKTLALNPRQALIHLIALDPQEKVNKHLKSFCLPIIALTKLTPIINSWYEEELALFRSQTVSSNPGVVPTDDFTMQIQLKYYLTTMLTAMTETDMMCPSMLVQAPVALRMIKGDTAASLIAEVNAHIGNGMTGCIDCAVVTGSKQAYFQHLLGYIHTYYSAGRPAIDVIYAAANCHLKHLVKTTI